MVWGDFWELFHVAERLPPVITSRSLVVGLSMCVALAACASSEDGAAPSVSARGGDTTYPLTITNCGRKLVFTKAPSKVVLLNGSSVGEVESFIALGLQDRIVANSQSYGVSEDPAMVGAIAKLPTGGLKLNESFEVPREQVLAQSPDLVVSTWAGGFDDKIGSITRDQLDKLKINSYVPPSNCAFGAKNPSEAEKTALKNQSYENSYDLIADLGKIFGVQSKATALIEASKQRIEAAKKPVRSDVHILLVFPGMGAMNANGLPAVFGGPLVDSIINAAGGVNSFPGRQFADMSNINAEELAAAKVDVLVIGLFQPTEDAQKFADALFKKYPQWAATKSKNFVAVSDSTYLGPLNAIAIERMSAGVAKVG